MRPSILLLLLIPLMLAPRAQAEPARFTVRYAAAQSSGPLDGRLLLMISNAEGEEPRFQISDGPETQLLFGIDVDGWKPGEEAVFDAGVLGYPLASLADVPPGTYQVQALLHKYETFHRADGHTLVLASQPFLHSPALSSDDRAKLLFGPVFCAEGRTFPDDPSMEAGLRRFNQIARDVAAANGVPFLDFEAAVPKDGRHFSDDVHMTAAANEIVAKVVFDWLVSSDVFVKSTER